jgi:hypothetical protein
MNGATHVQNWFGLVPAAWDFEGTGDFNGDGKTDLLLREDAGHGSDLGNGRRRPRTELVRPGAARLALPVITNRLRLSPSCRPSVSTCPKPLAQRLTVESHSSQ